MKKHLILFTSGITASAAAADIQLNIEIPKLDVAGYHRPYVAAWIENPDHSTAMNLAVWYNTQKKNNRGQKWLKDLRQWWRTSGRDLRLPVDGVSGPTKPAGAHKVIGNTDKLPALSSGTYTLIVESAREHGGRELVKIPFKWDGHSAISATKSGSKELGKIDLSIVVANATQNDPTSCQP